MKLSSDEARAVAFVLGLIGLATGARLIMRPRAEDAPSATALDTAGLEDSSEQALSVGRARSKPLTADERIDVNLATAPDLDRLPGVGPALALRIVEERERNGSFDSAADLKAVRGIGPALLARLESHLAFGFASGLSRRNRMPEADDHARAASARSERAGAHGAGDGGRSDPLDINSATVAELEALPGVGPALAGRIVAKRDSLRGFTTIDDLRGVRGIGPAKLEKMRALVRL